MKSKTLSNFKEQYEYVETPSFSRSYSWKGKSKITKYTLAWLIEIVSSFITDEMCRLINIESLFCKEISNIVEFTCELWQCEGSNHVILVIIHQKTHFEWIDTFMNLLFPSWVVAMWIFKSYFSGNNSLLQNSHLNGLSWMC